MYRRGYTRHPIEIRETEAYARWFKRLRDGQAKTRVLVRVRRLSLGNAGDAAPVGEGVSEMRVHCGPGYRIYFIQHREDLAILLAGGDKKTQKQDIQRAKELARGLEET